MASTGVVDADGHVTESTEQLAAHIDPAYRDYGPWPGARTYYPMDAWDRSARGTLGETAGSAKAWLEALDRGRLECAVLYPTAGLAIGWVREPDLAVALCRAYNDFFHQELAAASPRLKGVALLPLQDPAAAVAELRRARGLGAVGAMLPAVGLRKPLGHPDFWPIYAEAERLDCMVGVHATVRGPHYYGADLFDRLIEVHTLSHPFGQMIQMTSLVLQGVFDAFPRLRVAFLEAGCTWVPYWLGRLDEEWEKRGALEAPRCRRKPSEYLTGEQVFYPAEAGEWLLGPTVGALGRAGIVYASDFPHWDHEFPENIATLRARRDLDEATKRAMLGEAARRLYRLDA
jgi:predicted TIM-barrel fold metal-dependent hydrolase